MGRLFSKPEVQPGNAITCTVIRDIYINFIQSNKIIIESMGRSQKKAVSKMRNLEEILTQLLEPFQKVGRYSWSTQIAFNFKKYFTLNFQTIWGANRQQFYELLLRNCNVNIKDTKQKGYQRYFYQKAINELEQTIPDTFFDSLFEVQINQSIINTSMTLNEFRDKKKMGEKEREDGEGEGRMATSGRFKEKLKEKLIKILNKTDEKSNIMKEEYFSTLRVLSCSLLLPETIFIERLSQHSKIQVIDLLKYYEQLSNTLKQIFYSNNLISCPLKHFMFSIQDKVHKKQIMHSFLHFQQQLSTTSEETRKIRKTREINNNVLLNEVKYFLDAYTEFVWMYLQLHRMSESRFGKIINFQILYGIILKSVWNFVDWILQRGYEYEEAKLEEYYAEEDIRNQSKLSEKMIEYYLSLIENLRDENHPQQYLKKVVLFYRQVSKTCEDADGLLLIYEQIVARSIKQNGGKALHLFRMKNVIEKLLKIDEGSLNGGEISYSWATWCVLVELLREKVVCKYGQGQPFDQSQHSAFNQKESLLIEPNIYRSL